MSNYKHTEVTGDVSVILETDDSDFMREYIKDEDVISVDNVFSQTDLGEMKTDCIKDIADSASRDSSIATCVENLKCEMTVVFQQIYELRRAVEYIKNKEKRNGF